MVSWRQNRNFDSVFTNIFSDSKKTHENCNNNFETVLWYQHPNNQNYNKYPQLQLQLQQSPSTTTSTYNNHHNGGGSDSGWDDAERPWAVRVRLASTHNYNNHPQLQQVPTTITTMVVVLTVNEMMRKGLELWGFDWHRQDKACPALNPRRFKAHFGFNPIVCAQIWEALQRTLTHSYFIVVD
jgi:hypothetical protein